MSERKLSAFYLNRRRPFPAVAEPENVVAEPFQRLTYTEAIELLTSPEHVRRLV